MLKRLPIFLSFFCFSSAALADPTSVELILDCSGSMWNKLSDGRYRIDAAKQVLSEFIATAPEKEDLHIGLRLYGSKISHREPGACEDTVLVLPMEGFQRTQMLQYVKEARAIGATPLAISLNAAADDFTKPGKKQVIVFTDGEESCGGDVAAALARLKSQGIDADVRIIGIGLPKAVAERFAILAPIENADSVAKLAEALKNATSTTVTPPAAPVVTKEKVTVRVMKNGEPLIEGGVSLMSVEKVAMNLVKGEEPGTWQAELPPGLYTATVTPAGRRFPDLGVARGADNTFILDVTEMPKVTIEIPNEEITVFQEFTLMFKGANGVGDQYIILAPVGSPDSAQPNLRDAIGKEATMTMWAPDLPGMYEARFTQKGADYQNVLCGRSKPFEVKMPAVTLELPALVAASTPMTVKFKAPVQHSDWIGWVKAGAADGEYAIYARPSDQSDQVELHAPAEPGDYEMRYSNDGAITPFARKAFKVEGAVIALEAPDSAMAGAYVDIGWKGAPDLAHIYITIVEKGSSPGSYNDYQRLGSGQNTLKVQAPRKTGDMEIRINDEKQQKVLFSRPIKITEMKATVAGPAEAAAKSTLNITWTGPAGGGDFVTIVKAGAGDSEYLNYFYTKESAATMDLILPEEAGAYELRYVTGDNQVIARQAVTVK
ncbi:Ca-activated chloride channel family protein [Prosthecobacter fusiformis]|uniref:Ca-activated chloride channel family protein n=1 Tax=Prosthecobacter fusiformis TaxID=48464 RepID=A0A4R7SSS7_9BACT|nr:VWA domain-containing protein [Prosthecobacter fusiformis]TDU81739.1 Ca-activated chloride channel family protein [Prosthecobacter fusiformis]